VWVDLDRICAPVCLWPDPKSRSRLLSFWSSENCTILGLSPPPIWRGAENWWLIMIVWDLVYSLSEPDYCKLSREFKLRRISILQDFQRVIYFHIARCLPVVLCTLCMLIWPWPDPRSRSRGDDRQPPSGASYYVLGLHSYLWTAEARVFKYCIQV